MEGRKQEREGVGEGEGKAYTERRERDGGIETEGSGC